MKPAQTLKTSRLRRLTMKIEWVEEHFADLSGEQGVFTKAAGKDSRNGNAPKRMVPMLRTCHGDLVKAPSSALGM
jgi:hypothetical protein